MKRLRNEFFKHLHYLCLAGVIALGLMTIVATTGDNGVVAPGGPAAHPSGTLDTTFGGGTGFVIHNNAAGGNSGDQGNFITPGSFTVAGFSLNANAPPGPDLDMVVWKYNDNGTLNVTFGAGGVFVFDSGNGFDLGFSHAVDAMGRVVVTGLSAIAAAPPFPSNMAVLRLTATGMLDPTFGVGGVFLSTGPAGGPPPLFDQGNGITIDANGNSVVTGQSLNANAVPDLDMVVWRLLPTGVLDPAFGGGTGFVVFDGGNGLDIGGSIKIDANGNIVVTGNSFNAAGDLDMVVWRLLPSGMLDPAFGGGNGFIVFDGGNGGDAGNSIMPGSILVAGFITNAALDTDMAVWDFNTDGTLNVNFGNNGILVHDDAAGGNFPGLNFDLATSMTTAANNRILVTGSSTNAAGDTDQVTWRVK